MSSVRGSRFQQLMKAEFYMRKARQQISVLDNKLIDLHYLLEKSQERDLPLDTSRINRRISVTEGIRGMYFEYICAKTEEISVPSQDLYDEDVVATMAFDLDDFTFNE